MSGLEWFKGLKPLVLEFVGFSWFRWYTYDNSDAIILYIWVDSKIMSLQVSLSSFIYTASL
jgi:hypothetical protein